MRKCSLSALLMLVFLCLPLILFVFLPKSDYSETEKRYLAEFPALVTEDGLCDNFGEQLETYVSDHFPLRNLFVGVSSYWKLLTGRNASESVIRAKDGYLMQAPASDSLEQFTANLARFDRFAESAGLTADLVLIPSTGYVLSDLLPRLHEEYADEEGFTCAAGYEHLRLIDLREAFASAEEQVYYRTDHHMTSYGSFLAAGEIRKANGLPERSPADYTITARDEFRGTTWSSSGFWLTPADTLEVWDPGYAVSVTITEAGQEDMTADSPFFLENLEKQDRYTVFLDGNHTMVRLVNPDAAGGKLVVVRDSFANCIAPFLAEDYREILLVDLRYYRYSLSALMAEEEADGLMFLYGVNNLLTDSGSAWLY